MRLLRIEHDPDQKGEILITLSDHSETEGQNLRYAILSHRRQKGEVLFADVADPDRACSESTKNKKGFVKLEICCRIVLEYGLQYLWADTCCVDQNSSAEMSEAVNSAFKYYTEAEFCIAYLDDIEDQPKDDFYLSRSTWFLESWTLQALVASRDLHYYSRGWNKLGTKASLSGQTFYASGVAERVLIDPSALASICVSEKMSWGARRMTLRAEDRAYSLMGLFDVNMPLLYGEGGEKAFRRLQLEIIQTNADHTIFAWDSDTCTGDMLAPSVSHFTNGSNYESSGYPERFISRPNAETIKDIEIHQRHPVLDSRTYEASNYENRIWKPDFNMTNAGLHIQLPTEPLPCVSERLPLAWKQQRFAILGCRTKASHRFVAICLGKQVQKGHLAFSRMAFAGRTTITFDPSVYQERLLPITDYNPMWISKNPIKQSTEDKIPPSTQRIRFELWIKGKQPMSITTRETAHETETMRAGRFVPPPPMYNDKLPPEQFTNSIHPIQHYVSGILPANRLEHEVITFSQPKTNLYIAFGEIDGYIWMQSSTVPKGLGNSTSEYSTLHQTFCFPEGSCWRQRDMRMLSLVQVDKQTWKPLSTTRTKFAGTATMAPLHSLPYSNLDVIMESSAPGEMAMRMYLNSTKKA